MNGAGAPAPAYLYCGAWSRASGGRASGDQGALPRLQTGSETDGQADLELPSCSVGPSNVLPVFCFCLDLPVQILKPATFTDTAHYPLLLVV